MSSPDETVDSAAVRQWIDEIADRFEAAWLAVSGSGSPPPKIDDHLGLRSGSEQAALIRELVHIEVQYRVRRGERLDPDDYIRLYPNLSRGAVEQFVAEAQSRHMTQASDQNDSASESGQVDQAGSASGRGLCCPHCHNPIPASGHQPDEVVCGDCGSSFRIEHPQATSDPKIRQLGRFRLLECVGSGAFGSVWKARDTDLHRVVALKIPHQRLASSEVSLERFRREARAAAQLRHPGIVTVHEVTELDGLPTIVSDFIEGVTLQELLRVRRLTYRETAELVAQVAEALDYAHATGLVHRDLKPGNIMIEFPAGTGFGASLDSSKDTRGERSSSGRSSSTVVPRPLLMDFGLALRDEVEITLTSDGQIIGTPAYMSPEQGAATCTRWGSFSTSCCACNCRLTARSTCCWCRFCTKSRGRRVASTTRSRAIWRRSRSSAWPRSLAGATTPPRRAGFNGTVGLNLAGSQDITDLAGNALPAGEPATDETYVVDNDDISAQFTVDSVSGAENAGALTFTVRLSGPVDVATSVEVSTSNGTALVADNDYSAVSNLVLNFAAGETSKTFEVALTADDTVEADETFSVSLSNVSAGGRDVTASSTPGTGTITNDDGAQFTVDSVSGAENAGPLLFTVTLSRPVDVATSVQVSTSNGTALVSDGDHAAVTDLTLNFAAGETSKTFEVSPTADSKVELDETFSVSLSNVSAGGRDVTASSTPGMGTITNDDSALVSVTSTSSPEGLRMLFSVQLSNLVDAAVSFQLLIEDGTAQVPDADYAIPSQLALAFPADFAGILLFSVETTDDLEVELDESFTVRIGDVTAGGRNVTASSSVAIGTILNEDSALFTINDASGAEGGGLHTFTITLSSRVDTAVSVEVSTADGTASVLDSDYTAVTNLTVDFAAGETSKTVQVTPRDDNKAEADETFTVSLGGVSSDGRNVTSSDTAGTGTITNDDTNVSVAVTPGSVTEDATGTFTFTFSRTGLTSGSLSVNFDVGGSAAFVTDYTQAGASTFASASGTVTFGAGATTVQVTIDPTADSVPEANETVTLTVVDGTGYTAASPDAATATILTDEFDYGDARPSYPTRLADDGARHVPSGPTLGANRDAETNGQPNTPATGDDTAGSPDDEDGVSFVGATLIASETTATIGQVQVTLRNADANSNLLDAWIDFNQDDDWLDPGEQIFTNQSLGTVNGTQTLNFTVPTGTPTGTAHARFRVSTTGNLGPTGLAGDGEVEDHRLTLLPGVSVAVSPSSVPEDGPDSLVFTFTRSEAGSILTANFTVSGTAAFGADYTQSGATIFTASSGTVTFPDGADTVTVTIDPVADAAPEPDETVVLTASIGTGYNIGVASPATGVIETDEFDFGDAPSPYLSTLADDGPRHQPIGPTLGAARDVEGDGQPTVTSSGDDGSGTPDDEDGVRFGSVRIGQSEVSVRVNVQNAPAGARLDGWIDWNRDGDWDDNTEQVATNLAVVNGDNVVTVDLPDFVKVGATFARFRVSSAGGLGVTGESADGEVEDHQLTITQEQSGVADWTVMIYMTASDLGNFAQEDLDEMERAAASLPETVKLAVLLDRAGNNNNFTTGQGQEAAWTDTGRAIIVPDATPGVVDTAFERFGEQNTGDPDTLVNFIEWAAGKAPANRYVLVLWDHGKGLLGMNFDNDVPDQPDRLEVRELADALGAASVRFDLVAFDECTMAMAEIAHALAGLTDVMVASQEGVPAAGFDYETAFAALESDPAGVTAVSIAEELIGSYQQTVAGELSLGDSLQIRRNTLSAIRLDKTGDLVAAIGEFTTAVLDAAGPLTDRQWAILRESREEAVSLFGVDDYRDLGQFMTLVGQDPELCDSNFLCDKLPDGIPIAANAVVESLRSAVIDQVATDLGAGGLSIFFPKPGSQRLHPAVLSIANYTDARWYGAFQVPTRWAAFLNEFVLHTPKRDKGGRDGCEANQRLDKAQDFVRAQTMHCSGATFLSLHRSNDQDWYSVQLLGGKGASGSFVAATVTTDTAGEVRMSLYDRNGALRDQRIVNSTKGAIAKVSLAGREAGIYYAVVDSPKRSIFQYTLSHDFTVEGARGVEHSYDLGLVTENHTQRGFNVGDGGTDKLSFQVPRQEGTAGQPPARVWVLPNGQQLKATLYTRQPDGSFSQTGDPFTESRPFQFQYSTDDGAAYRLDVECKQEACTDSYDVRFVVQRTDTVILASEGLVPEDGPVGTLDVFLTSQPSDVVTIRLSSSSQIGVSETELLFTPLDWDIPQVVTVTAADDDVAEGDHQASIDYEVSSLDPDYDGDALAATVVRIADDDAAGITVSAISGNTTEAAGSATFTVVLTSQPTADVTVTVASNDATEGTMSAPVLTFTAANWNAPQTVTVTGVDDAVDDGDVAYTIVTSAATSTDGNYNGLNAADVGVTNTDNDTAGITVSPTAGLITTEDGGTATFTVVLTSQPTADVTVGLESTDSTEGVVSLPSLTFTPVNWNTPQMVTVTGVNDAVDDGDVEYTLVTAAATSNDPAYRGLNAADVAVRNLGDDDVPPRIVNMVLTRDAKGKKVLAIRVTFNEDINGWQEKSAYKVETNSGRKRKAVPLGQPVYDTEEFVVTIPLTRPIATKKQNKYTLTVFATGAVTITDAASHPLAGDFQRPLNQEGGIAAAIDELLDSGRLRRDSRVTESLIRAGLSAVVG